MRMIAADDETLAREMLVQAILEACPDAELHAFAKPSEVLEFVKQCPCDIAFLDIHMRGMDGVELAERIRAIAPQINIIFATGFDEYTRDAMALHASGYIMKPVTKEKVLRELNDLRYPIPKGSNARLRIQCFGNFEVYDLSGQRVYFKRSKAKEALAYLVYRQGAGCTIREIAAALFEDAPYDIKQQSYMQQIVFCMNQSLKNADAQEVMSKTYNSLSLQTSLVDCDYYRFLENPSSMQQEFKGEFMSQYAWAEDVAGYLEQRLFNE